MLKVRNVRGGKKAKVTFALPLTEAPNAVSVAGDFNGWDPFQHPLKRRSNGMRSASIEVELPARIEFKYLAEGGVWFNDPDASSYVVDDGHQTNSVLEVDGT